MWDSAGTWTGKKMSQLVVKCQNCRVRSFPDKNGTIEAHKNALCLRLLGKIADIDERELRADIGNAMKEADPIAALIRVFCDTFHVSYYCAGCKVFMDVRYTAPGYEVRSIPRDESEFGKIMRPKVTAKQIEVA